MEFDATNVRHEESTIKEIAAWLANFLGRAVNLEFRKSTKHGEIFYDDAVGAVPLKTGSFIDAFIDDPELKRSFSNLYNDFRFSPVPSAFMT